MSSPFAMFADQEPRKDGDFDGNVIDSYDIEIDAPPKPIIEPIPVLAKAKRLFPTLLIQGYQRFSTNSASDPFMILPPDVRRVALSFRLTSFNAAPNFLQFVAIAGEKTFLSGIGNLANGGAVFLMRQGKDLTLNDHTGAVWAAVDPAGLATEGLELSWIATTLQPDNGNDTEIQ